MELANHLGVFICVDEHKAKGDCFDFARIMVCVDIGFKTPDVIKMDINGKPFSVFL